MAAENNGAQFGKLTILQLPAPKPWVSLEVTAIVGDGLGCSVRVMARDARTAIQSLRAIANAIASGTGEISLVEG